MILKTKTQSAGLLVAIALSLIMINSTPNSNAQAANTKQEISLYSNSDISSLDVSKVTDSNTFTQLDNVNEGLYQYDKNGKPKPALATKTIISNDKKTYTINLRKNAHWSNGDPVTAHDFVYSWRRAVNPDTASEYIYLLSNLKNAEEIAAGKKPINQLGVEATGKYQLKIQLNKPQAYFKMILARETLFPLNKKVVEKYGKSYGTSSNKAVYNGPFVNTGWNGSNSSWKLKPNPYYWDKKHVKLQQINYSVVKEPSTAYNLYQTNKLDQMTLVGEQAKQMAGDKDIVRRPLAATQYLQSNLKKGNGLENKNIRTAISLSINRKQITKRILSNGSTPASGFVSQGLAKNPKTGKDFYKETYVKNTADYNPKLARKLFKKGLQQTGKKKIEITLLTTDIDTSKQVAEFIQGQIQSNLSKIKVTMKAVPANNRIAAVSKGDYDIVFQGWSADFADPYTFLQMFTTKSPQNHSGWSNTTYDQAIADSNNKDAANKQSRWNDMVLAEKTLLKNQGVTPLYRMNNEDLVNPKLKGILYNQVNGHYVYKNAYLTK
ncbi:peptide ABC transporter substrate-binding protein [Bombilactobacillus bombi]|uniref:Peptide ABC transporter substrate-binding protein n=1 Tax=Bombilactobacillus bombi TaxID=1303590 RepID=A0A3R6ZWD6_9LACO|nr:peptide ABC transporter substrate-binding protein [Bombilactobacillus bombi]